MRKALKMPLAKTPVENDEDGEDDEDENDEDDELQKEDDDDDNNKNYDEKIGFVEYTGTKHKRCRYDD